MYDQSKYTYKFYPLDCISHLGSMDTLEVNLLDAYALEWDDCMFYSVQFSCFFLFDVRLIELDDAVVGEGGVILANDSIRF